MLYILPRNIHRADLNFWKQVTSLNQFLFINTKFILMKKLALVFLLLGVMGLFTNCNKDDDENEEPEFFLRAKVNGDDFSSGTLTAIRVGPFINITALQGLNTALSISVAESLSPGNYDFDAILTDEVSAGYGNSLPGGISVDAESGIMIITQLDTMTQIVAGTFEFSGTDANSGETYNITEGEFKAQYE